MKRKGWEGSLLPAVGRSPEEWVGQQVLVEIIGAVEYQLVTRLEGINGWGVLFKDVAPLRPGEERDEAANVFYPWERIMAMRPAREEDLGLPEATNYYPFESGALPSALRAMTKSKSERRLTALKASGCVWA